MASYMPTLALRGLNTGKIVVGTDVFKVALITSAIPATTNRDNTTETYGGADFTEHAGTGNYSTGGAAITLAESQYVTGGVHHSAVSASASTTSWASVTLSGVTGAILYDTTPATKYVMACFDFGGSQSVTANTFTINWTDTTPNSRVWFLSAA